ncbi:aminotransferase class IV [Paenibacillus physcomitrellae]|uniref:4-amino-4-deoxychorismate lyase n=1 Tax=Paenibacillus physcomitrellae TaxID=1619311 RepID=A0ABQ1GUQ6_9BACL|nr:aminotransferase class IV [Paenibacillus physcomitrellae]GGA50811.1 4-amino-4-deoxychorismate lyase [Paenibacillus physcomitrellae]
MNYVGVNGRIVPTGEAMVSVMDHGFLYGMGLFETFRTYGGVPFLLEAHLDRLREGCRAIGIPAGLDQARITELIQGLMEANGLEEAYIRYTVTAGEAPLGLPGESYKQATEIVYVKPLPPLSAELYTKGKALYVLDTPRNTPEGTVRLKSLHYMNNILAKQELTEKEAQYGAAANPDRLPAEGLMLTADGKLAEGIVSNLFVLAGSKLYTPSADTGILPGITRRQVIRDAGELGVKVVEGRFDRELLSAAEEVLVTNSVQELVPVTRVIGTEGTAFEVSGGKAGTLTRKLLELYRNAYGGNLTGGG